MTVKELIIKLFELNPNLPIYLIKEEDEDKCELKPINVISPLTPSCGEQESGYILN